MRQELRPHLPTRRVRFALALGLMAVGTGCSRGNKVDDGLGFEREPIPIHVKNENFLDMNIAVVAGGVSRRLGQVTGNSSADFKIAWAVANGQLISIMATPIGGRDRYVSAGLSVGSGQMIEVHLGSVLRQSSAIVQEPQ